MPPRIEGPSGSPQALIISQIFYPEMISTGQILTELGETLADLGANIEVWCGPPTLVDRKNRVPRCLKHRRMVVRRVRGTRLSKIQVGGKMLNQFSFLAGVGFNWLRDRSRRPALVTTDPPFLAILCALLGFFRSRPIVYLVLDVYPDTVIQQGLLHKHNPLAWLWNGLHRSALRRAAAVVVLGRRMADIVRQKGQGPGALAVKTHMIHLWSDEHRIRPRARPPGLEREVKFELIYAGNMGWVHDMETIMRAAEALAAVPRIHFTFIGEGFKKRWMEEFARRRSLSNCRFGTYLGRDEFGDRLAAADAGLVSLTRSQEGLSEPCKTFGIMAAGQPVLGVLPRASEMAGIIREHRCGVVVDPGDVPGLVQAIGDLAGDSGLCAEYGRRGREAIESRFGLGRAAGRYLSLLNALQPDSGRS